LILELVKKNLSDKKIDYEVLDLYKMKFNPILSEHEHYTSGHKEIMPEIKQIQEKMKSAGQLIFIYPVWWFSMPAILHGFFDRTLTSGFAFKYKYGIPLQLLRGLKAICFITSGGPKSYYSIVGNLPQRLIKSTLRFNGIRVKVFQLFNCRKLTEVRKKKIEKLVKQGLRNIKA